MDFLLDNVWFQWKKKKSGYKQILISNEVKPLNFLRNALQIINSKQTTFLSTDSVSLRFFYSRSLISTAKTWYENSNNVDCITIKLILYLGMLHNLFVFCWFTFPFMCLRHYNIACICECVFVWWASVFVCANCGFKRRIQ